MNEQKIMNRWFVVVGAILIQLSLGAIYAWSVFTKMLTQPAADGGAFGFTTSQTMWVFSAGLAAFAIVMVLAGRMLPKYGPRKLTIAGGITLAIGYILAGFFGTSFMAQLFFIGIVGGAGIGLAYVVPIKVGIAWFPDKKGLVSGLGVAGFGFGALLWVKLAGGFSGFDGLLRTLSLCGLNGVQSVFLLYGIIFGVLVLIGSISMVNPPAGYKPEGWNPPAPAAGKATGSLDLNSMEMLKTPQYWGLLLMFTGSAIAGLMVIGVIKLFGIDALQASKAAADAKQAGIMADTAMAWYAILNGIGRIAWGMASDKIGRKASLIAMCALQGIIMLLFFKMGGTFAGLVVGACIIGFNFGGNFALFPAATADFFGNKNVGSNYGWVFLAYGVAGIVGPQVASFFKDRAIQSGTGVDAWVTPFIIAGICCLAASFLGIFLKAPKAKEANEKVSCGKS